MLTRRTLLGAGVSLATFRNDTLERLAALDGRGEGAADDEAYWAGVRRAFDVETDFLFLNHGGLSPSPRAVQDAQDRRGRQAERAPSYYIFRKQDHEVEAVRKRLATLFKADPEEIALLPNASTGLFTTILGAPAERGDLMVSTEVDYPRVQTALDQRARRNGIVVEHMEVPEPATNPDDLAAVFDKVLLRKPRLLVFPRVAYLDGTLFPAARLCAKAAEHGVPTLVDGAHGFGHLENETAPMLGCDYYATCLHKWILGPLGTGFLYVKKSQIKETWPLGAADATLDEDVRKFEQFGTKDTPRTLAIHEALDAHEAIGEARKGARLEYLRKHWTSQLAGHPKIRFHTNLDPAVSRVLTTVSVEGIPTSLLANWLFERWKIFVTTMHHREIDGIRVTAQIFTTPAELDRLVAALRDAAERGID